MLTGSGQEGFSMFWGGTVRSGYRGASPGLSAEGGCGWTVKTLGDHLRWVREGQGDYLDRRCREEESYGHCLQLLEELSCGRSREFVFLNIYLFGCARPWLHHVSSYWWHTGSILLTRD